MAIAETTLCPICDTPMKSYRDVMDGWCLCEETHDCPNGHYSFQFAYGNTQYFIGTKEDHFHLAWNYQDKMTIDELKKIDEAIDKYRRLLCPSAETNAPA